MPLVPCLPCEYDAFVAHVRENHPLHPYTIVRNADARSVVLGGFIVARRSLNRDGMMYGRLTLPMRHEIDWDSYVAMVQPSDGEDETEPSYCCGRCSWHGMERETYNFTERDSGLQVLHCPTCGAEVFPRVEIEIDEDPSQESSHRGPDFLSRVKGPAMLFALLLSLCLSQAACGSPRHDGVPWEHTEPHAGDSMAAVDALYGRPESIENLGSDKVVRHYKHWRAKNEFGGLDPIFSKRDHHRVVFVNDAAVSWSDQP